KKNEDVPIPGRSCAHGRAACCLTHWHEADWSLLEMRRWSMRAIFVAAAFVLMTGAMASSALAMEVFEDRLEHMSTLRSHSSEANRTGHVRLARATSSDEEEFAYRRPRHRVSHAAHSRKASSHRARHRTAHARRAVRHARAGRVRGAH